MFFWLTRYIKNKVTYTFLIFKQFILKLLLKRFSITLTYFINIVGFARNNNQCQLLVICLGVVIVHHCRWYLLCTRPLLSHNYLSCFVKVKAITSYVTSWERITTVSVALLRHFWRSFTNHCMGLLLLLILNYILKIYSSAIDSLTWFIRSK